MRAQAVAASEPRILHWGALALISAVLVSCFSGYHAVPVPFELKWQISPLGLLLDFNRELLGLETAPGFAGRFGFDLDYLAVFLKTCLMEAPFYALMLRRRGAAFFVSALLVANLLTHPAVYFVFPWMIRGFFSMAMAAEAFAPLVEILYVLWLTRGGRGPSPWAVAALVFAANLFSWQMGAFL